MTNTLFPDGREVRYLSFDADVQEAVEAALAAEGDFSTGWIAVSKMDCSVRIWRRGEETWVEVELADADELPLAVIDRSSFCGCGGERVESPSWERLMDAYERTRDALNDDLESAYAAAGLTGDEDEDDGAGE